MFKVICTDDKNQIDGIEKPLIFGNYYTASEVGRPGYEDAFYIEESLYHKDGDRICHYKKRFSLPSDIDETEMQRNYDTIKTLSHR